MNKSEQINELATALSKFQGKMITAHKGATNPFFKSTYADLASVVKSASPGLAEEGLSIAQLVGTSNEQTTLTTLLMHASGQFISAEMPLLIAKQDAQGQGSALTYARRYAYMAIIGMVADEDDDGQAAVIVAKKPTKLVKPTVYNAELDEIAKQGRQLMVQHNIVGKEALALSSMVLDKDKPESIEDWEAIIKAIEDQSEQS